MFTVMFESEQEYLTLAKERKLEVEEKKRIKKLKALERKNKKLDEHRKAKEFAEEHKEEFDKSFNEYIRKYKGSMY